jgi:PQQ-like domain
MHLIPSILAVLGSLALSGLAPAEQTGTPRRFVAADDSTHRLAIVAADGSLEWELPTTAIHDAWILPNGNILTQYGWNRVVEVTKEKKVVWEYDAAKLGGNEGKHIEVHAFQRLANGLTMIAESGSGRIIEVDQAGKIQHEIKLKCDHPNAHSDTRLARVLENGHYLVAQEADGHAREYDRQGHIVWDYEVPLFDKKEDGGHGPEAFGNKLFSAIRLPNGNTLIGTGNGHSVLEVTPEKKIVWEIHQKDLPGITLAWVTRVDRLPNGNTLIGNCHAGPDQPQFIEVTPEKKVVWTFKDFKNFGNSMPVQFVIEK